MILVLVLLVAFGPWEYEDTQQPVEQQTPGGATQPDRSLWVTNPTGCAWDADDSRSAGFVDGVLAAGTSVSGTKCVIADDLGHAVWFHVLSRSPDLIVTTSFAPQDIVLRASPVPSGRYFEYWTCSVGPEYDHGVIPSLPLIDGSNGGHGLRTDLVVNITNPTSHAVRKLSAVVRLRPFPDEASGGRCQYGDLNRTGTYPGPFIAAATS